MGEKKAPSSQEEGWGDGRFCQFLTYKSREIFAFPLVTDQWQPY